MSPLPEEIATGAMDSPLGPLVLAVSARGLLAVLFGALRSAELVRELSRTARAPVVMVADRGTAAAWHQELAEYFAGGRRTFTGPLDLRSEGFVRRVHEFIRQIPFGHTMTYGEVAAALGSPGAARAVGQANARNPLPIVVPCHRVVAADGGLGGYSGGLDIKRWLLARESDRIPDQGQQ